MDIRIETEQEEDGRWLAEVIGLPGVMAYGTSRLQTMDKAEALAFVHWLNVWNTMNPTRRAFPSHWPHEQMAFNQGQACFSRA